MQTNHKGRREVLPLRGAHNVDGPVKYKQEINSAGMKCRSPPEASYFIFRHRAQDYLLKKSTISKYWSKRRRDGLMQRTLSD